MAVCKQSCGTTLHLQCKMEHPFRCKSTKLIFCGNSSTFGTGSATRATRLFLRVERTRQRHILTCDSQRHLSPPEAGQFETCDEGTPNESIPEVAKSDKKLKVESSWAIIPRNFMWLAMEQGYYVSASGGLNGLRILRLFFGPWAPSTPLLILNTVQSAVLCVMLSPVEFRLASAASR